MFAHSWSGRAQNDFPEGAEPPPPTPPSLPGRSVTFLFGRAGWPGSLQLRASSTFFHRGAARLFFTARIFTRCISKSNGYPAHSYRAGSASKKNGLAAPLSLHPLMFPIGLNSATFLVMPARSTVSTTSEMFL